MELRRTLSKVCLEEEKSFEESDSTLIADATPLTHNEYKGLLQCLEDFDWIPPTEYIGRLFINEADELFVLARGSNNNYFLIYI